MFSNSPIIVVSIDEGRIDIAVQFEVNTSSGVPVVDEQDADFEGNCVVISSRDGASYIGEVAASGEGRFVAEESVVTATCLFLVGLIGGDSCVSGVD